MSELEPGDGTDLKTDKAKTESMLNDLLGGDMTKEQMEENITQRLRNDHLLNMAYCLGKQHGLNELEILKRFILMLLNLKDEAFQEKVDELMHSTKPAFIV